MPDRSLPCGYHVLYISARAPNKDMCTAVGIGIFRVKAKADVLCAVDNSHSKRAKRWRLGEADEDRGVISLAIAFA